MSGPLEGERICIECQRSYTARKDRVCKICRATPGGYATTLPQPEPQPRHRGRVRGSQLGPLTWPDEAAP